MVKTKQATASTLHLLTLFIFLFGFFSAPPAGAVVLDFQVFLDLDNSPASGCTVGTVDGPLDGVEQILITFVDTDTGQVTRVVRRECMDPASDTFGSEIDVDDSGWPVGNGNGTDGASVIETYYPLQVAPYQPLVRLGFISAIGTQPGDALLKTGNEDILFAPWLPTKEVPTLSQWGLALLALILLLAGAMLLRRHPSALSLILFIAWTGIVGVGLAWASSIVLDGQIDDWNGIAPLAEDPPGDGVPDIIAVFTVSDPDKLFFRFDAVLPVTPSAVDDGYGTRYDTPLNVTSGAGPPPGLLQNDTLGIPPAGLTSFGGGSLGGTVTTHAVGASVALAGGSLTVNADGSFSLTGQPFAPGTYTFLYRLANPAGTSDATVTLTVFQPPTAVDDTVAAGSSPGEKYHTALNTTLIVNDGPGDLLANDLIGSPAAVLTFFGGGSLGGSITDHPAGTATTVGTGSLQVNLDGSLMFTPDNNFTGLFTFQYRIANPGGTSDATVTLAVGARPDCLNDAFDATGNISLSVAAAGVMLDNGSGADSGDQLAVTTVQGAGGNVGSNTASSNSGTVNLAAAGGFTYDPPAGFNGNDTFTYTVGNGFGDSGACTVTVTVTDMIWFIDNQQPAAGDGRLSSPFNALASFESINGNGGPTDPGAGDAIFVYTGSADYTGGINLENVQLLIGQGAGQTLSAILAAVGVTPAANSVLLPVTGGTNPNIVNNGGTAVTLAGGNRLFGLDVGTAVSPQGGDGIIGANVGGLVIENTVEVTTAEGMAADLANGNGSMNVSFAGVTAANPIGGSGGVRLQNNPGSQTAFGGLNITGTSAAGLLASNAGTLNITGGANSVATTTGTAVSISNTAIGSGNVTFRSVSSNGAANGIVLDSTGTSGGFIVTGNGGTCPGTCTGGRIQNTVGADGATAGRGVSLNNTANVSLSYMRIDNHPNFAIRGENVTGFSLQNCHVDGTNGTNPAFDEGSIRLNNLLGTAALSDCDISGGQEDNLRIDNSSGTLASLNISNSIIHDNQVGTGNNGILFNASGTATVTTADISGCTIRDIVATGLQVNADNSAAIADWTVRNSTFQDNNIGINLTQSGNADLSFDILNNTTITGHASHAINLFSASTSTGGSLTGTVSGNTIGSSGVPGSGSAFGSGIRVNINGQTDATVRIDNNTIDEIPWGRGIEAVGRLGTGGLDLTIDANTVSTDPVGGLAAIYVESNDGNTVCANIFSNTASGGPYFLGFGGDFLMTEGNGPPASTFNLEGTWGSAVAEITASNTPLTPAVNETDDFGNPATNITIVAPGSCYLPPL